VSGRVGKPQVLLLLPLEPELEARLRERCEVVPLDARAPAAERSAALREARGVLLSNQLAVDAALLDAAPQLRVVAGVGVGYDRFDLAACSKRGVAVCNTPDVLTECVVNLTFGLLLALSRRLFEHQRYAQGGGWARREPLPPLGFDLRGKLLGVIGFGRIGREVTRRAQVFGLRTLWNDRFDALPAGAPRSEYRPLERLLAESDVVSLHVDLNPSSHHLLGAPQFARMKRSAWLINTSRGPVVDQPALAAALRSGDLAGAALDVLEEEPPRPDEPLLGLPNVLAFPHIGTSTLETRYAMRELAVRNLLAVLAAERPPSCVNPEVLAARGVT
jgi:lactate dehydrogenase-like 2-hydroxyacid dehydrogenase